MKLIGATAHYATASSTKARSSSRTSSRVSHRDSVARSDQIGRDIERTVLARAVGWHCQDRVLVDGRTAVVF